MIIRVMIKNDHKSDGKNDRKIILRIFANRIPGKEDDDNLRRIVFRYVNQLSIRKKIEIASSPFRQAACTTVCVKREVLLFAFNKYTNPSPKSDLKINKLDLIIAISKNFFFQIDFQLELKEKKFEFKFGGKKHSKV
jgi:hypothetical protein